MSHSRFKTTYNEMGAYGSVETHTLYVHHNHSADYVSFYNEKGEHILTVEDTMDNNIFDAMKRLLRPWVRMDGKLAEGVERMEPEEFKIIGH